MIGFGLELEPACRLALAPMMESVDVPPPLRFFFQNENETRPGHTPEVDNGDGYNH